MTLNKMDKILINYIKLFEANYKTIKEEYLQVYLESCYLLDIKPKEEILNFYNKLPF